MLLHSFCMTNFQKGAARSPCVMWVKHVLGTSVVVGHGSSPIFKMVSHNAFQLLKVKAVHSACICRVKLTNWPNCWIEGSFVSVCFVQLFQKFSEIVGLFLKNADIFSLYFHELCFSIPTKNLRFLQVVSLVFFLPLYVQKDNNTICHDFWQLWGGFLFSVKKMCGNYVSR